jgi:hypothetical protein
MVIQETLSDNSNIFQDFWRNQLVTNERNVLRRLARIWKQALEKQSIPDKGVFALTDLHSFPAEPLAVQRIQDGITNLVIREWIIPKKEDHYRVKFGMIVLWAYYNRYDLSPDE